MKDYQISIDKAIRTNSIKLARAIIARKNKSAGYIPVGLKCSKRDRKSLTNLYNSYANDLISELLIGYGIDIGVIKSA